MVYDDENTARASHNLIYDGELLRARRIVSEEYAGSARFLTNLPVDKFNGEIDASFLNHGNGLQNIRGTLQAQTNAGISCDETGLNLNVENGCGLALRSKKLTIDLTKAEKINNGGQNFSNLFIDYGKHLADHIVSNTICVHTLKEQIKSDKLFFFCLKLFFPFLVRLNGLLG